VHIRKNNLPSFNVEIPFHPLFYFLIFLFSNSLLSYFSLSVQSKIWIVLLGVVLPFGLALWSLLEKRLKTGGTFEAFSSENLNLPMKFNWFSLLFWSFIFFLILTRFYHLTTLPFWPMGDEGIFSILSLGLLKKWSWSLIWAEARMEPLLLWGLTFFFKLTGPSLMALRLFTAFFSLLTAGLSYWAVRKFFPRSFSLIFSWFFSFSFPQLMLARQCTPNDLIPPLQFLALGVFGAYLKASAEKNRWGCLFVLSIVCGLGFYSYVNWAVIYMFITIVLLIHHQEKNKNTVFLLITFFLSLPLLLARLQPGSLVLLKTDFSPASSFSSIILYTRGLLWNALPSYPLGPDWGGLLDPVTGSFLILGLLWIAGEFPISWILVVLMGFFSSLLPGILSSGMELQRITPAIPWLLGVATMGFFCLANFNFKYRNALLILGLSAPLILNVYNFSIPYCDIRRSPPDHQWRSLLSAHAFQILQKEAKQNGPLYVFSELNIFYDDKTLTLACYPFDALQNPELSRKHPRECALLLNVHYSPFLQKRFPFLRYEQLEKDSSMGLYLVPTSQISPHTLNLWVQADQVYRDLNTALKNKNPLQSWIDFLPTFKALEVQDKSDPLLMAVYWEKVAFFKDLVEDYLGAAEAYKKAVEEGYPASHLYYDQGSALSYSGKTKEAKKAFRKAAELSKNSGV